MRANERPVVVKFGGSFAFSSHLPAWVEALAACASRAVIVPGGGPFADTVRAAQLRMGFDDPTAHHMALLAMEQYGRALAACNATLSPADSIETMREGLAAGRIPVWMPVRMVLDAADVTPSWDVTSDSLAAWLGSRIGGDRLFLIKHAAACAGRASVEELAALGVVDKAFPTYLRKSSVRAFVLGPADHDAVQGAIHTGAAVGVAVE